MPSTKGKPKNSRLYEETKDSVKSETNKDGSGKGQWSAWKARKLAKSYEEAGGEYENEPGSKNEPRKGSPKPKSETRKDEESGRERTSLKESEQREKDKEDKPEENSEKKPSGTKGGNKVKARKKVEAPADGSRRSARLGNKRRAHEPESGDTEDDGTGEEDSVEEKAPRKRKNTTKK